MFNKILKRLIAKTCVAALLFMQLAVAAYACAALDGPASVIAAHSESIQTAMPDCDMRNESASAVDANLCLQHCHAGNQSVQTLPQNVVSLFAAVPTLVISSPHFPQAGPGIKLVSMSSVHATFPPPLSLFGVLRI